MRCAAIKMSQRIVVPVLSFGLSPWNRGQSVYAASDTAAVDEDAVILCIPSECHNTAPCAGRTSSIQPFGQKHYGTAHKEAHRRRERFLYALQGAYEILQAKWRANTYPDGYEF